MLFWWKFQGSVWILWGTPGETLEQGRPGVRLVSFHNDMSKPKLRLCYQPDWPHFNPCKHQGAQTSPSPTNLLCCPWCLCRTGNLSQTDPNGRRKRNCSWQVTHYLILGVCNQFGIAIGLLMTEYASCPRCWWWTPPLEEAKVACDRSKMSRLINILAAM